MKMIPPTTIRRNAKLNKKSNTFSNLQIWRANILCVNGHLKGCLIIDSRT